MQQEQIALIQHRTQVGWNKRKKKKSNATQTVRATHRNSSAETTRRVFGSLRLRKEITQPIERMWEKESEQE